MISALSGKIKKIILNNNITVEVVPENLPGDIIAVIVDPTKGDTRALVGIVKECFDNGDISFNYFGTKSGALYRLQASEVMTLYNCDTTEASLIYNAHLLAIQGSMDKNSDE